MSYAKSMRAWARGAGRLGDAKAKPASEAKNTRGRGCLTPAQCEEIAAAIRRRGTSYAIGMLGYSQPQVNWVQGEMYLGKFGGLG